MRSFNRRSFLKLIGQGTAVLGFGLSGNTFARTDNPKTKEMNAQSKYQIFYPGKYMDWERKVIEERLSLAEKNPLKSDIVNSADVVKEYELLSYNATWDPYNPLFNDRDYAQKAGYPDVPAWPAFKTPRGSSVPGIPRDFADSWYFANDGGRMEFFAPIYAGDSLTTETEKFIFEELTVSGSNLRHFKNGNTGRIINQKGDMVVRNSSTTRQAYRKIIDGSPKPTWDENMEEWVEYFQEGHYTTDEEWEYIQQLWEKESIRGSQKLYWEDVQVGDEPPWTCSGPVSYMDIVGWSGGGQKGIRWRNKMEETKTEYRDRFGNYLSLESMHYGGRNIPGSRMVFYNSTAANHIIRLVTNYIGDAGFVTKFYWFFKQLFKEMQVERPGGEYLDKVPYMKGKECTVHGSEGDTVIGKGYVTDKYINDKGEHIIDLTCWGETLDKRIIQIVPASARLPSKKS